MSDAINVVEATLVADHVLAIRFDDGAHQVVDFKPFLSSSRHPQIRAYLDPARFAEFRIEYGELIWGDHELGFPMIDLYQNTLLHHCPPTVEAA